MSDLDQQLSTMLAHAARNAPSADGLASAARRRRRTRRRRRLGGGMAAAALVAVTAGAVLGRGGGDDPIAHDPTQERTGDGWSEVSDGVHVFSVPADWRPMDCEDGLPPIYAAPGTEPCADGQGARLGATDEIDLETEPGALVEDRLDGRPIWGGVVGVGQSYLSVSSADRAVARRILASGRLEGLPAVAAGTWSDFNRFGLTYEVPTWWGLGQEGPRSAYSVCLVPKGTETPEGRTNVFVLSQTPGPEGTVVVSAPTQAVAELVMATVQVGDDAKPGECTPEDFSAARQPDGGPDAQSSGQSGDAYDLVTVHGIELEVPSGWTVKVDCNGVAEVSAADACQAPLTAGIVRFYEEDLFDPAMNAGEIVGGGEGEPWVGFVRRGQYAVYAAHADRQVVEYVLSRVK